MERCKGRKTVLNSVGLKNILFDKDKDKEALFNVAYNVTDNKLFCDITITGQPRYVKLAYLEYMGYVEVIVHSRIFPYIALYFDLAYVKLGYHENSAISKRFFIPKSRVSLY